MSGIYFSLADERQGADSKIYYISLDRKTHKGNESFLNGILLINDDIFYVIELLMLLFNASGYFKAKRLFTVM